MELIDIAVLSVAAFMIGAIPFSYIITRMVAKKDIRTMGSHNPGATNVFRSLNLGCGLAVLILDMAKGFIPVYWAMNTLPDTPVVPVMALSVVLGHDYSPFLGMKGGKGVATSLGVFLILNTQLTLLVLLIFVILTIVFGFISFASVIGAASYPVLAYVLGMTDYMWLSAVLAALIIGRHHSNLKRLWHGKETKTI